MKGTLKILVLLLVLVVLSVLSWFIPIGTSDRELGTSSNKLVVITPHWDGIRNEFRRGFRDWVRQGTGKTIEVEYLDQGGTSDCVRYILSEFKRNPEGIGVDLFFGGGTDPYLRLKEEQVLVPVLLPDSVLAGVPQKFSGIEIYDADRYWYGAVLSGFGMVYNKWVVHWMKFQEPAEWKDLANRQYASWVGAADPRNSGTMHLMFEIILQAYGWEQGWRILTGLAANTKGFAKGANEVPKMVARGDVAFGLAIDFYGWAQVSEAGEDKVGFRLPRGLTVIGADAIGMLKGAPNAEAAKLFVEYVLSEPGQKLWFLRKGASGGPVNQELNRMTVRPDFYDRYGGQTNVRQNPFASPNAFEFDSRKSSKRWGIVNDLAGIALIDHGQALKKAWERLENIDAQAELQLRSMPVTEEECLHLVDNAWRNPVEKNRILLEWHQFFQKKYASLAERLSVSSRSQVLNDSYSKALLCTR